MSIPDKCFTCEFPLGNSFKLFYELVEKYESEEVKAVIMPYVAVQPYHPPSEAPSKAMNELKLNMCCRRSILTCPMNRESVYYKHSEIPLYERVENTRNEYNEFYEKKRIERLKRKEEEKRIEEENRENIRKAHIHSEALRRLHAKKAKIEADKLEAEILAEMERIESSM